MKRIGIKHFYCLFLWYTIQHFRNTTCDVNMKYEIYMYKKNIRHEKIEVRHNDWN